MTDKPGIFGHGTAETWIVAAASLFIVAVVGFIGKHATSTLNKLDDGFNSLDRRFIAVETNVQAVQLQLVDIPNMKLEQARQDVRMQQLAASIQELQRDARRTPQ